MRLGGGVVSLFIVIRLVRIDDGGDLKDGVQPSRYCVDCGIIVTFCYSQDLRDVQIFRGRPQSAIFIDSACGWVAPSSMLTSTQVWAVVICTAAWGRIHTNAKLAVSGICVLLAAQLRAAVLSHQNLLVLAI